MEEKTGAEMEPLLRLGPKGRQGPAKDVQTPLVTPKLGINRNTQR